jgi:hypothetical protein
MSDMKTFLCPNCKQFINSSMTVCKFCNVELDPATIAASVENQEKVNAAYNSASKIRILAGALVTFFLLSLIPFLGIFAGFAFYAIFLAVPCFLAYWAIKYSGINTHDQDYKTSKKYIMVALFIWLAFPVAYIALLTLAFLGIMATQIKR